ncbi:hypothetical protein TWF106_006449 [Orbilia oligospora]|uniref:Uncharacterized protein n=1 Tax=Orbilia oligospora TaxID=2813651 RepID=A0A7C8QQA0_ORBOL|nr:hypothetical protein TWF106_006449 [Orbilia oligospora]
MNTLEIQAIGAGSSIEIKRRLGSNSMENEGTDTFPARPKVFECDNKCKKLHKWDDVRKPVAGREIAIRALEYKDYHISYLNRKIDSLIQQVEELTELAGGLRMRNENLTAANQA